MRLSIVSSAFIAALVGFGSTIAIVIAAAQAVGANAAQTTSWVAAICLSMAATTGYLSVRYRMPVVTAWSTPGAALIAASSGISIEAAVGAFLLVGVLIVLAAAVKPFGRPHRTHPHSGRRRDAGRRSDPLRHGGVRERARSTRPRSAARRRLSGRPAVQSGAGRAGGPVRRPGSRLRPRARGARPVGSHAFRR